MVIDSNIIIYALNPDSNKHLVARKFIHEHKNLVIAQQNIFETLRIISHAKYPHPLSSKNSIKIIKKILVNKKVITPKKDTPLLAFKLIEKYKITGLEVFDAYLVATALDNDITQIATDNIRDLGKYKEIKVVNPFV